MPHQQIKFYQVGSFVAGNRLLRPDERSVQARMERSNTLTSGHRACQGCGEALGPLRPGRRHAGDGRAARRGQRDRVPRGLLHALPGIVLAASLASLALRERAGGRVRDRGGSEGEGANRRQGHRPGRRRRDARHRLRLPLRDVRAKRRRAFICYDNEAYMNTGVQRSSATPPAARTANTKPVGRSPETSSARARTLL